ncbi:protein CURLY FLAG LEAF 1-like [Curcuma longa]|uniref:protein CURLY FLAG LEAF 1-like n=1 Tax=Curcuma longa TaxID=136217 RepID=UPI003D9F4496
MDFPYIDQIAASLRSCSLGEHRPTPSPPTSIPDASAGRITVELNSEIPLPFCWEQRLDIQTGEIHYINWETGERTTADPRSAATASTYSSSYYYTDGDEASGTGSGKEGCEEEEDDDNGIADTADPDEDEAYGTGSGIDTSDEEEDDYSTAGSSDPSSTGDDRRTLVAAGCSGCFMYLMVPKGTPACSKCGAALIHLGNCL